MSEDHREPRWLPWQPVVLGLPEAAPILASKDEQTVISMAEANNADVPSELALQNEYESSLISDKLNQAEQQGYTEGQQHGFAAGYQAGYEAGKIQGMEDAEERNNTESTLKVTRDSSTDLHTSFGQIEDALVGLECLVPAYLIQLALSAVKSLIGQPILQDHFYERMRQQILFLLDDEPLLSGHVQIWVCQEDNRRLTRGWEECLGKRGWELREDNRLLPGGCRITFDGGEIDERIETRWKALCDLRHEGGLA